jgi:aconitate hydratase
MKTIGQDSLNLRRTLRVEGKSYEYFSLPAAAEALGDISRLPFTLKILLERFLLSSSPSPGGRGGEGGDLVV